MRAFAVLVATSVATVAVGSSAGSPAGAAASCPRGGNGGASLGQATTIEGRMRINGGSPTSGTITLRAGNVVCVDDYGGVDLQVKIGSKTTRCQIRRRSAAVKVRPQPPIVLRFLNGSSYCGTKGSGLARYGVGKTTLITQDPAFGLFVGRGGTAALKVVSGRMTARGPNGKAVVVSAKQQVAIPRSGNPGAPRPLRLTKEETAGFTALGVKVPMRPELLLGLLGDPSRFDRLTGQQSRVRLVNVGWGQGDTYGSSFAELFETMGERPMLGLSTARQGGADISPGQIARGAGDAYLVALNRALAAWGRPIYVRPFGEMNGYWNTYCAFNRDGSPRDGDHSTAMFKKAFARVSLIVHGGARVDAELARRGLPPLGEALEENPHVRVIWNPQGYGNPALPANSAQAYYPGDDLVDVVGDDLYFQQGKAEWDAAEDLYRAHPGKSFGFPEWALWGLDDPSFVERMATFLKTHPRTELALYYSGPPGSVYDLATKPRSLAAYKRLIVPLGG